MTMRYLTLSELIYINGKVVGSEAIATGRQKVRDLVMLEAAEARPAASAFGQDAYPTLGEKAAALLHSIARNHPFTDGNKRTAAVAALMMLAVNGAEAAWDAAEALDMIVRVAENQVDVPALAAWLEAHITPGTPAPEPDADADMSAIARLIETHRWLLDELNKR
jgi:death-on-curing protein